ncbi:ExbD/TolR family protein [Erythrobacter sp. Alg231-14]|uniref:ExbD/TolR family protein n=1 Tax=Erythrobacter sp. Alg231-14 TaxID=1922225 RepID=UPI00307B13FF
MPRTVTRPNKYGPQHSGPQPGMNVTPFIDVLLVLLVMMILAIPIQTHQTTVDLPDGTQRSIHPVLAENTVFIDASDQIFWNGSSVTNDQLRAQITAASAMEEEPLLRFEPAGLASYNASAQAITLIKESGATRFAFVGNERYRALD